MEPISPFSEIFPQRETAQTRGPSSVEELGSEAFLELMVAQLENQDPSKPMDNMQFIAQLAQFGSVSGIQELNESFAGLSAAMTGSQGLQAASLVGRNVVTDSNIGVLQEAVTADGEPALVLDATVDLGSGANGGNLYVQDLTGRMVYSTSLPPGEGDIKIRWDGRDAQGNFVPPGRYRISAEGLVNGQSQALSVYAHQQVQSVAVDAASGQVTLELAAGEEVSIDQVIAFL
jgi:flagellar basal-body rod modification protein FlgD